MRLLTAILLLALALASLFVLWDAEAHPLAVDATVRPCDAPKVNPCAMIDCNRRNPNPERIA
jgi:hypothetical protein